MSRFAIKHKKKKLYYNVILLLEKYLLMLLIKKQKPYLLTSLRMGESDRFAFDRTRHTMTATTSTPEFGSGDRDDLDACLA